MSDTPSFCPYCGVGLASGASFCQVCGKQIVKSDSSFLAPTSQNASKFVGAWSWFKARSLKGKVFYGLWALINLVGFFEILALFAPDNTIQTGCGARLTMGSFLDGTYEACGPTQSEQVLSKFFSLLITNVILLLILITYKKVLAKKNV